jgi:hypothetical protein
MSVDGTSKPGYQFCALGLQFACEVTIPERAASFDDRHTSFRNHTLAKQNAAKEAVMWLREQRLMEGNRPLKKKHKPITSVLLKITSAPSKESEDVNKISFTALLLLVRKREHRLCGEVV